MLSGDNGILQRATTAKENTDNAQIKERIQLAYLSAISGGQENLTEETFKNELIKEFGASKIKDDTISTSEDGKTWTVTIDGASAEVAAVDTTPTEPQPGESGYAGGSYNDPYIPVGFTHTGSENWNYGYTIIRTQISKVLISKGLNTCIGFFHRGIDNNFNLSDDIIEVFRPIIDDFVLNNCVNKERFSREDRLNLIKLSTKNMLYHNQTNTFLNVINMYISEILEKITTNKIEEIEIPLFRNYNV